MKNQFVELIVCPYCKGPLALKEIRNQGKDIIEGLLLCRKCEALYPIINGIPRMSNKSIYANHEFFKKHEKIIKEYLSITEEIETIGKLEELQKSTIEKFSFEWKTYSTFGWNDPVYNIGYEKKVFYEKTLFEPWEFENRIVLDAGCGNGRYLYWADRYGAKLAIGIDLGYSVDVAKENLRNSNNVQLIQCDIFHLPFREAFFDIIYSIGVLMHTGDAKKATECLVSCLKKDGNISVHLYHKSNPLYERLDTLIRSYTTRLSIDDAIKFTKQAYALAKVLYALHVGRIINGLIFRIDDHPHCIFDWYTAPIATHHDYKEVYRWFSDFGVTVMDDQNVYKGLLKEIIKPLKLLVVNGQRTRRE